MSQLRVADGERKPMDHPTGVGTSGKLNPCLNGPVVQIVAARRLYCGSSLRSNGSVCEYCVVTSEGEIKVETVEGNHTVIEMQWLALIEGLKMASAGDTVCTDNKYVANQVRGKWPVGADHLKPYANKAKKLLKEKRGVIVWQIKRGDNLARLHLEGNFR